MEVEHSHLPICSFQKLLFVTISLNVNFFSMGNPAEGMCVCCHFLCQAEYCSDLGGVVFMDDGRTLLYSEALF